MGRTDITQRDPGDYCFLHEWDKTLDRAKQYPNFADLLTGPVLLQFEYNVRGWDMGYQWCLWLKHKFDEYKPPRKNSKEGKSFYLYQPLGELILALYKLCEYLHGSQSEGIFNLDIPFKSAGDWLLQILLEIQLAAFVQLLPIPEGCEVIVTEDYQKSVSGYSTKKRLALKTPKEKTASLYSSTGESLKNGLLPEGWTEAHPEFSKLIQTVQAVIDEKGEQSAIAKLWKEFVSSYKKWTRDQTRNPQFGISRIEGNKLLVRDGTSHERVVCDFTEIKNTRRPSGKGFQPS